MLAMTHASMPVHLVGEMGHEAPQIFTLICNLFWLTVQEKCRMSLRLNSLPRSHFLDVTQRTLPQKNVALRDIQKTAARETKDLTPNLYQANFCFNGYRAFSLM